MLTRLIAKTIVISPEGTVLVLRRSKTDVRRPLQWDLPGGYCEPSEQPYEAAIRETKEEAGITIARTKMIFAKTEVREWIDPKAGKKVENVIFLFFLAYADTQEVILSSEHNEFKWLSLPEALEEFEYPLHKEVFQHMLDNHLLTS